MSRGGRKQPAGPPVRTCVACRTVRPKRELRRVAIGPDGLVLDERQALPGRGAYVCAAAGCGSKATRALSRALRVASLGVSPDLVARLLAGEVLVAPQFEVRPRDEGPVGADTSGAFRPPGEG